MNPEDWPTRPIHMKTRIARTTAALVLAGVLGGCNGLGQPGDPVSARDSEDRTAPGNPTHPAAETTLQGTVRRGVESNCLEIRSAGEVYLLIGPDTADLSPGRHVVVTGTPEPEVATACMQGIPFRIGTAEPLP